MAGGAISQDRKYGAISLRLRFALRVGMVPKRVPVAANHLFGSVAEHARGRAVHKSEHAVAVQTENSIAGGIENQIGLAAEPQECLLSFAALGDVQHEAVH